jgi:hypothetical protein
MITLAQLAKECGAVDLPSFQRRYGEAFLLYTGQSVEMKPAHRQWQPTKQTKQRRIGSAAPEELSKIIVYPLPDSTLDPWVATVGRVEPNHVLLPDESVSVFHAIFSRGKRGEFLLQDAGSKNGTFVNDEVVLHRDHRRPRRIKPNDGVRFGSVILTFLLPAEIHDLIRVLAAVRPPRAKRPEPGRPSSLRDGDLFDDLGPSATGANPLSSGVVRILEAAQLIESGMFDVARERLGQELDRDPNNLHAKVWLKVAEARQLAQLGDRAGAAARYREVLALDENNQEALRVLRSRASKKP